jgi:ABC-2 type transport system ATP-binding protein
MGPRAQAATRPGTESPVNSPAVRVRGLTKRFGSRLAVDHATFDVPAAAVTGIVGPNGAGKTTTIRILLGLARPTAGTAEVLGQSIGHPARYLPRVGALIEGPAVAGALSGRANLLSLARLGGIPDARADEVLEVVGLRERADDPARSYSLGMRQRLGIAAALLPDPALLVLDEPTNGLDPAGILEIRALLAEVADRGTSVVVSSHLLGEIEAVCSHLVVMVGGRIAFAGPLERFISERRSTLRLTPDDPADLAALIALCHAQQLGAHADAGEVVVDAREDRAAELNRRAMESGIALRGLRADHPSLEEAFMQVTEAAP